MNIGTYRVITQQLVEPGQRNFIGKRTQCRYCGETASSEFGKRTNAHTFPMALGNRSLFSLDECKICNEKFSRYEDALVKAIGPFLTLGGVKGRSGVRNTGRSNSGSTIRHNLEQGQRRISIRSNTQGTALPIVDPYTGFLKLQTPVLGDKFIPRHAYKALLKMALSLLPDDELPKFSNEIACLNSFDAVSHPFPLQVGFSYASVGNAPPALAGILYRRNDRRLSDPYMIFILMAGSVCFQIWPKSDELDNQVPSKGNFGIKYTAQLPKPEGGYLPIEYCEPIQFDWSSLGATQQPFGAFNLTFDPRTTAGTLEPMLR
jgi:hypothetical protein